MVLKSRKPCTGYFSKISITVLMVVCMPNLLRTAPLIFLNPFWAGARSEKWRLKMTDPLKITRIMFALAIQAIPTNIPDLKMKAFSV